MQNHGEPSDKDIEAVRAKYPDRALAHVTAQGDAEMGTDEAYHFIMTGPSRVELEKYQQEIEEAGKQKSLLEKNRATTEACERAMLAQIRWPDRPTVEQVFTRYPNMPLQFTETLIGMAGDSFKVRAKKL